ncbi:MAG: LysR family transcriptional regulator [Burkholderiales bacterium]|nr:LysR family transcriptional regulator [Burkholderiales bacterium]
MNLQQIEAICAVVRSNFNFSAAAVALHRTQPTLSRQIQELEDELGVRIFMRTRNKVVALTPDGEDILRIGQRMVLDAADMRHIGRGHALDGAGELRISTTHLHARYTLPRVVAAFTSKHAKALLTLRQGDPVSCCELVANGEADIGVTTVGPKLDPKLVALPAFKLPRCLIAPRDHPIADEGKLTLRKIAKYPIVAYSMPFSGRRIVDETFAKAGLRPRIVCSAIDADVSKTYVDLGMGIAILAEIAFDPSHDSNLLSFKADHLFRPSILNLVMRKHGYLTGHARAFLSLLAPHLSIEVIRQGTTAGNVDHELLHRLAPVLRTAVA